MCSLPRRPRSLGGSGQRVAQREPDGAGSDVAVAADGADGDVGGLFGGYIRERFAVGGVGLCVDPAQ